MFLFIAPMLSGRLDIACESHNIGESDMPRGSRFGVMTCFVCGYGSLVRSNFKATTDQRF